MKRDIKRKVIIAVTLASLILSCAEGANSVQAVTKDKKIIMNRSKVTIAPGSTFRLKVKKVKPLKTGKAVTYKSCKKKVATVSKQGLVKAKKVGTVKIIIASKKNRSVKTTVTVKVKKKEIINKNDRSQKPDDSLVVQSPGNALNPENPINTPKPSEQENDTEETKKLPEMYLDIISNRFSLKLGSQIGLIALDLTNCRNLSDADKQTLTSLISAKYGRETIQKSFNELKEDGDIVDDDTYGYIFKDGVLITISEIEKEAWGFSFNIECMVNGLNAEAFINCKAYYQDNKWTYELGEQLLA